MRAKIGRSYIIYLFIVLYVVCLSGCANTSETQTTSGEESATVAETDDLDDEKKIIDGYEEILSSFPKGLDYIPPAGIGLCRDGTLMVFGSGAKADGYSVWISDDLGATWEDPIPAPEEFPMIFPEGDGSGTPAGTTTVSAASCSPEGEFALIRSVTREDGGQDNTYWIWKPGEDPRQMDLDTETILRRWKYTENGELLAVAANDQVYLIDPGQGEILAETPYIQNGERVEYYQEINGTLVMQTESGVMGYDFESGEFSGVDAALETDIFSLIGGMYYTSVGDACELAEKDGVLYQIGKTGIFQGYGENKIPLIEDASAVLGNSYLYFLGCYITDDQDFLIPYVDNGRYGLLRYRYSGEGETEPEERRELVVYTLKENGNLTQAAELYRNQNTDVEIRIETGLSESGGITVSDALRNLSTKIMAGEGPDVILLDGMPVEDYIEKGILMELMDVYQSVEEGEGLMEDVAGAYSVQGSVYAIPTHFYVPVVIGEEEQLDGIKDADTLTALAAQTAAGGEQMASGMNAQALLDFLGSVSSPDWILDDRMQEDSLRKYMENLKTMCEAAEVDLNYWEGSGGLEDFRHDFLHPIYYANEKEGYSFGLANGFGTVSQIQSALDMRGEGSWKLLECGEGAVFIPSAVIGVSSKAKNPEDAKAFAAYILSAEVQEREAGSGFPVNETAAERQIEEESGADAIFLSQEDPDTGGVIELDVMAADMDTLSAFYDALHSVSVPELSSEIVKEQVKEYALAYTKDETGLGEAMENLKSRISLYLAE